MKPTFDNRKELATLLAQHLRDFCDTRHPGLVEIHWDDCDMEERRFWFHFRVPSLGDIRQAKSKVMRMASKLVLACVREAEDFLSECPYEAHLWWGKYNNPRGLYRTIYGRKYFDHYDSDTWIKVLSFYG